MGASVTVPSYWTPFGQAWGRAPIQDAEDEALEVVNRELGVVDAEEQGDVAPVAVSLDGRLPDLDGGRLSAAAVAS